MSHRVTVTAEELWKLNRDTADACLAHPFVQGIASGDLSRQRFQVLSVLNFGPVRDC